MFFASSIEGYMLWVLSTLPAVIAAEELFIERQRKAVEDFVDELKSKAVIKETKD